MGEYRADGDESLRLITEHLDYIGDELSAIRETLQKIQQALTRAKPGEDTDEG